MKLDRGPLACFWPDDVHEYLSQCWSPLSSTLIYDTVAPVECRLIMYTALLIYSSKLKALVQGFLSHFQPLNNVFLFFCATCCVIAMLLSLSSALLQMNWLLYDPVP